MAQIRSASPSDAPELAELYRWYVERTAVTYEYAAPDAEAFLARMRGVMESYPYLVAEEDGRCVGYAYAAAFHPREAYRFSVETVIYLRRDARGRGLGRELYAALEAELRARGFRNLYACIGWPDVPDEYLTRASAVFHERMGYRRCGYFRRCGYKFGRWYSMIWMEKIIAEDTDPA